MIFGVCVQHMWNTQAEGQGTKTHRLKGKPLWHSTVYSNIWHHNGATIATACCNHSGPFHNNWAPVVMSCFTKFLSILMIQIVKMIPSYEIKTDTYFFTCMNIFCAVSPWAFFQLNAFQASPVIHLVIPLECISVSTNTQPSFPAMRNYSMAMMSCSDI